MCNYYKINVHVQKANEKIILYEKYVICIFPVFVCLESIFCFFHEYNTFLSSIFNGIPQELKKNNNKIRFDFKLYEISKHEKKTSFKYYIL